MQPATSQLSGKATASNLSRISPSHLFCRSAISRSFCVFSPTIGNLHLARPSRESLPGRRRAPPRKEDLMPTSVAACVCEQLTVSCSGDPAHVSLCHCLACQRRTGSTYGIAAFYPRENVRMAGDATAYTRQSDSGYPVTFYFCPHCGSTVYWKADRKPEMVAVAVGAFADPAFPAPSQAVYAEHRHGWLPNLPAG